MSESSQHPSADVVIDQVVDTIAETTPEVRGSIASHREYVGRENPTGDDILAADVHVDGLMEERLLAIDGVATYASEERPGIVTDDGEFHVVVDPLDGSSNLDPNSGMGTIFGVYGSRPPTTGRDLLAAGFVIYGPATTMVVARDGQAREYVLEDGRRTVVDDDVSIPDDSTVYGFGGGVENWTDDFSEYASEIRRELKLRYGGAMIADVSQVLTYGGVFAYPALQSRPDGKLRLQFEGHPMGYVVEAAGGRSSDGERSLLDVEPTELHQRTPLHLGNPDLIERLEATLSG